MSNSALVYKPGHCGIRNYPENTFQWPVSELEVPYWCLYGVNKMFLLYRSLSSENREENCVVGSLWNWMYFYCRLTSKQRDLKWCGFSVFKIHINLAYRHHMFKMLLPKVGKQKKQIHSLRCREGNFWLAMSKDNDFNRFSWLWCFSKKSHENVHFFSLLFSLLIQCQGSYTLGEISQQSTISLTSECLDYRLHISW